MLGRIGRRVAYTTTRRDGTLHPVFHGIDATLRMRAEGSQEGVREQAPVSPSPCGAATSARSSSTCNGRESSKAPRLDPMARYYLGSGSPFRTSTLPPASRALCGDAKRLRTLPARRITQVAPEQKHPTGAAGPVIVGTFGSDMDAQLALLHLEEAGIEGKLLDDNIVSMDPPLNVGTGGIKLIVRPGDAKVASEVLERLRKQTAVLKCPECGSTRIVRTCGSRVSRPWRGCRSCSSACPWDEHGGPAPARTATTAGGVRLD
jgi:hypothetical protein